MCASQWWTSQICTMKMNGFVVTAFAVCCKCIAKNLSSTSEQDTEKQLCIVFNAYSCIWSMWALLYKKWLTSRQKGNEDEIWLRDSIFGRATSEGFLTFNPSATK